MNKYTNAVYIIHLKPMETVNEQLIWKIEAWLSAVNSLVNCQISMIEKNL